MPISTLAPVIVASHAYFIILFRKYSYVKLQFWQHGLLGIYEHFNRPFYKIKNILKKKFKEVVSENYTTKVQEKLSKLTDSSKLYLYSQLKSDIKLENYLLIENSFEKRQLLTKFRVSDHSLEIETGLYKKNIYNTTAKIMFVL